VASPRQRLARFDWDVSSGGRIVVAGVDEAGRGCWAGPVVAAAVILAPGPALRGLADSKRLSAPARERLFARLISGRALCWAARAVSPAVIDRVNILQATLLAMSRAVNGLAVVPELVLVDGDREPRLAVPVRTVVRGDATSASVAAASVVAKVLRDRVMTAWDRRFPGYGFADHKGYGSSGHRRALRRLGPSPLHRSSYRPVASLDQGLLWEETAKRKP
jgi:ribonuclease HII